MPCFSAKRDLFQVLALLSITCGTCVYHSHPNPEPLSGIYWSQNFWHYCSNSEEGDPLLPPKGLSFPSMCFSLKNRITFFFKITLKVLSFSPEFKNKVNPQMTGYNLEKRGGKFPPTQNSKSISIIQQKSSKGRFYKCLGDILLVHRLSRAWKPEGE